MKKRMIIIAICFTVCMGVLAWRIYSLGDSEYARTAVNNNTVLYTLGSKRGLIYDRDMEPLVETSGTYYAAVKPTAQGLSALESVADQNEYDYALERLQQGKPVLIKAKTTHTDSEDVAIVESKDRYSVNQLAAHIIGYLDSGNANGASGIEKVYDEWLSDIQNMIRVTFSVDALGRILNGVPIGVDTSQKDGNVQGVQLTLDKQIQAIVENAGKDLGIGAVVVSDVKTEELRASASFPSIYPSKLAVSLNADNSPFLNRAFTAYSIGSIFKVIVAAAALEEGISEDFHYECTGSIKVGNVTFNCQNSRVHGRVDMKSATAKSCNTYFIRLAQEIGADPILNLAREFGLEEAIPFADGMQVASGTLPARQTLALPGELANFSFGQGKTLATPVHFAAVYGAIANNGLYIEPTLVKSLVSADGTQEIQNGTPNQKQVFSEQTAKKLREFLVETVENGTGSTAKTKNLTAAGKTATAQTGWYEDGAEVNHSWFAGYYPEEDPQYVIIIMKETGTSGSGDCAPIFKKIADSLYEQGLVN